MANRRFTIQTDVELRKLRAADAGNLGWEDDAGFPTGVKLVTLDVLVQQAGKTKKVNLDVVVTT